MDIEFYSDSLLYLRFKKQFLFLENMENSKSLSGIIGAPTICIANRWE